MSRLPRPYIPLAIRVVVVERQLAARNMIAFVGPLSTRIKLGLKSLFGDAKAELHHRPALVNRRRKKNGTYDPDANDPDHLEYLVADAHDVETRIRGRNGAHSDLGMARKNKRIAKNREPAKATGFPKSRSQVNRATVKHKWPSRPFAKGRRFNRRKA